MSDRQREAMDSSRSLCITAGAGAGKTRTLVEKYIHLIKSGVAVSEILALTFTEKAAAEMKHRVRRAIMELQGEEWDRVKDEINWCTISTFHAFCVNVIRELPLETGVPPNFVVLEDVQRQELLNEAWDHLMSSSHGTGVNDALVRLLTDVPQAKLLDTVQYMYDRRSDMSPFLSSFSSTDELLARWSELVGRARRDAVDSYLADPAFTDAVSVLRGLVPKYIVGKDAGCRMLAVISSALDDIRPDAPCDDACKAILSLRGVQRGKGSKPVFGLDLESFRSACSTVLDTLDRHGTDLLEDEDEEHVAAAAFLLMDLTLVLSSYEDVVKEMKCQANAIDFEDMISIVHDLFVSEPQIVKEEFTSRFRYILVDEFQDTDAVQSDIIWRMAGGADAKEKLFIVGDPKQSIYLFRNVDVSMFKEFQGRIEGILNGRRIHLETNYRSSPQIIRFVNHVFGQLMQDASRKWEFQYQEMERCELRKDDEGSVELLLLPDPEGSEAEFVARRIQDIVENGKRKVYWSEDGKEHLPVPRPAGYGDIAVLLRAKTRLHDLEDALGRYGIPYRVHGGLGFFERQEIVDVANLLSFLSSADDDLSLYGILRSPYFAFSDEQLFHMLGRGHGTMWARLRTYADGSGDEHVRSTVRRLERWLYYAPRLTVPQLLGMVYRESGMFAVYGALPDGELMVANLEKLLSMVRGASAGGFLTLSDFRRWMQLSMEVAAKEGLAQLTGGEGSVKVMTVHAAKGLEFPIVFVPEMNFYRNETSSLLLFSEDAGVGVDAPDPKDGHKLKASMPKKAVANELASKETAERKRLLYVALTRAKDHLVMCGNMPDEKEADKELWMNWLLEALSINDEDVEAGEKVIDHDLAVSIVQDPMTLEVEEREASSGPLLGPEDLSPFISPRAPIVVVPSEPPRSPSRVSHDRERDKKEGRERTRPPEIGGTRRGYLDVPTTRGTIIHEVLSGKDAGAVLRKYGIDDATTEKEFSGMYDRLMAEPCMAEATAAYRELAFMAKVDGVVYKGRMDLLLQNGDGTWTVVDHKTGSFEGGMGEEKVAEYREQMRIYERAVADLMKKKVNSVLWLVDEERTLPL